MVTKTANGGTFGLHVKRATVGFGDSTATEIFELPPNSYVVDLLVDVVVAFTGGTALLDIGISGTAAYFANDVDVSSTGRATVALLTGGVALGDQPVSVVAQAVGADTAGSAHVMMVYFTLSHSHLH